MPTVTQTNFRLSEEHMAKLDELATRLSPVPLTRSQVLRLAIDRLYEHETKPKARTAKETR